MKYAFKAYQIINNRIINQYVVYDFDCPIQFGYENEKAEKELSQAAIDYVKLSVKEGDIVIDRVFPSCWRLKWDFKELPEEHKALYEESEKEVEAMVKSKEYEIDQLNWKMRTLEGELEAIKNKAIELEVLDSQEFLHYQDVLNKYSLDPDRK